VIWPYPEPITLLRTTIDSVDEYGNDVLVEQTEEIAGCIVWPSDLNASGSNESEQAQDLVISGYTVLAPPGTGIRPTDRVQLADGLTYEVIGEPGQWRSAFTNRQPGVQVALRRITG
jgi:hypothetical protein